ncbi:helix-turn-helix transcriptional regulator [uncultured Friedmanniella sp.]|uniref:helix-turn-helix transcriptional regulator n=1 Tax=uncultured Friedmanniella sp. TaxID=335381 RepID=UPI0035C94EE0
MWSRPSLACHTRHHLSGIRGRLHHIRADRLLLLTALLKQHGRLSARELARRLEVTERTVLRDVEALSAAGIPVYAERGRNGGFALLPGYSPDAAALTPIEAEALFLAGGHAALERLGLADPLASALRKLATSLPADLDSAVVRTSERILIESTGFDPPGPELGHLDLVQRAVFDDLRLRFRYQPRLPSTPGVRTVDPYGLVAAGPTWYLVAAHRGRPRTYRLSRMSEVAALSTPAVRPADLDLRSLWRALRVAYSDRPSVPLAIRTEPRWTEILLSSLSSQLSGLVDVTHDGGTALVRGRIFTIRGTAAVLAGFGTFIEVQEPAELRDSLRELGRELSERYAAAQPPATAGMIETLAPSGTGASRPPTNRTSSSPT